MNDDRARFLRALGMEYCTAGQHVAMNAYEYDGTTWCLQHPCPAGPIEGPQPGYCQIGRIHFAKLGVWYIPSRSIWACGRHLSGVIAEVIRRSEFGI